MKAFGDLSEEEKQHSADLIDHERVADTSKRLDDLTRAKMYVCIAHDWYQLNMEEEGARLILKAEQVYPGYFKGPVIEHQRESHSFDMIIQYLTARLYTLMKEIVSSK